MNCLMKTLLTLFVLLFSSSVFAEIVTLDDGRIINLNKDGTFTIISEDTPNSNNDIRRSIISFLNLMGVEYESIDFINDSNIILKNISAESQDINEEVKASIEKLEINNLNKNYFKDLNINSFNTYKGKIFDKIMITNLSIKDNTDYYSIGELEIDKFDLKEVTLLKDFNFENIFKLIDSLSINKFIAKEIEIESLDPIETYYFSSFRINDIRNSNIGSLIYTDYRVEDDEGIFVADIFEVEYLKLNNKNLYKIDWDKPFENPMDLLFFIDSVKKISCKGCSNKDYKEDIFVEVAKFEFSDFKIENVSNYRIPVSMNINFEGFTLDSISAESKKIKEEILTSLNYNQLKFDFKINLDWNTLYNIFSFDLNLGMQDGLDLNLSAKFEDVYKELVDFNFNEDSINALMEDPKIKNLEISIQDNSLTDRLLEYGALNFHMTKREYVDFIISEIQSDVVIKDSLQNDFIIAITNFIQQPDKITFSARPSTSLSYKDIINFIPNPTLLVKLLNIKIK